MKWSIRLGTVLGIDVSMHLTFLLLLAWVAWIQFSRGQGTIAALQGIGFVLAIFACVILHEFGHALTARRFGIQTRDITLLPIGGLARLERMPDEPIQELWVALAGPAVNVAIAAVLGLWLALTGGWEPLGTVGIAGGPFLLWLLTANLFLAVFNMIPAFPMDGGRVLRALLATRIDYTQATQVAATVGQGIALVFGFVGLFSNPMLLFIALFVWIGAAQEASVVQIRSSLAGIPVRRAMVTEFHRLTPVCTLAQAVEVTLQTSQKDFPVEDGPRLVGILTQEELIRALSESGPSTPVVDVMLREFETLHPGDMLERALALLREARGGTLPVLHEGHLVGLVTMDNVGELLSFQGALRRVGGGGS